MARRMTEALSSWDVTEAGRGRLLASSKNTSVSLLRRQRAASRDFSLRFSEFLHTIEEEDFHFFNIQYNSW